MPGKYHLHKVFTQKEIDHVIRQAKELQELELSGAAINGSPVLGRYFATTNACVDFALSKFEVSTTQASKVITAFITTLEEPFWVYYEYLSSKVHGAIRGKMKTPMA